MKMETYRCDAEEYSGHEKQQQAISEFHVSIAQFKFIVKLRYISLAHTMLL